MRWSLDKPITPRLAFSSRDLLWYRSKEKRSPCSPLELETASLTGIRDVLVRLAGIEPTFGLDLPRTAPLLDFAKTSRVKKAKKWMTQVDDIQGYT